MKLIFIAFFAALVFSAAVSAQSEKQKAAIEREIRKLDAAHADAVRRGDLAAMDRIWTTDFKVNNPFNEVDNAKRIRTGVMTYASFVRTAESVSMHKNTVIVMGSETVVPNN